MCVCGTVDGIVFKRHFAVCTQNLCETICKFSLLFIDVLSIVFWIRFHAKFISFFLFLYIAHSWMVFLCGHYTDLDRRAAQWTRGHREAISATMDSVSMASMRQVCMDHSIRFARAVTVKINSTIRKTHCMEERTWDFLYVKGRWILSFFSLLLDTQLERASSFQRASSFSNSKASSCVLCCLSLSKVFSIWKRARSFFALQKLQKLKACLGISVNPMEKHMKNSDRSMNFIQNFATKFHDVNHTFLMFGHLCNQLKRELEVRKRNVSVKVNEKKKKTETSS